MIITGFSRQQLPLCQPLPVRGTFVHTREVLRIRGEADGRHFLSDCAPLPGLHPESLDDCEKALEAGVSVVWQNKEPKRPCAETPLKSLKCALEILYLLPSAREFCLERQDHFQNSQLLSLPMPGDEDDFFQSIDSRRSVLKLKFGRQDRVRERELLEGILHRVPHVRFRLDANQLLLQDDFIAYAKEFQHLPVDFYEEPCRDPEGLFTLCKSHPIGLDENLSHSRELRRAAAAWVLKPNLHGFSETLEYFAEATRLQKPLILSNAFESRMTLQAYAWFYGLLVPDARPFGFGTIDYLMDKENWDLMEWPARPGGEL